MILALDVGNSNIVFGCLDEEKVYFVGRLSTDRSCTEDEYAIRFKSLMELNGITPEMIKGSIISSVVPPLINMLVAAVEKSVGKTPIVVGPGVKTGLNIKIDNPAQLGSDLAVDAVAALDKYPVPLVVIDMGTATTVSVIDSNKYFLGGMILPGVRISQEALTSKTSLLQGISLEAPKKVIGSNTIDSMKSGAIYGNAAVLDGLIERIEEELGEKVTAVATGGLSKSIVPYCKREIIVDDNLLLKGLWLIYKKNTEK